MKLTGLPSPFRLIMMLRPALRTSQRFFCAASSAISTTLPGSPRSPISSTSPRRRGSSAAFASPANSTSRIAAGSPRSAVSIVARNAGLASARSIIVRSTSSTAVGPSVTMCWAAVHRRMEGREVDDAEHLRAGQRRELQRQLARPGERAFGADQQVREVDAAVVGVGLFALRMEDVEVVAGDAAQHLRPARLDLAAMAIGEVADEAPIAAARPVACASGPNETAAPSASSASMPSTLCTMLP